MRSRFFGMGLGIALISYADTLGIGFNWDPDIVPDVELFIACFRQSFENVAAVAKVEAGPMSEDVNEIYASLSS